MIDVGDVTVGFLAFDIAPVIIKLWSAQIVFTERNDDYGICH